MRFKIFTVVELLSSLLVLVQVEVISKQTMLKLLRNKTY